MQTINNHFCNIVPVQVNISLPTTTFTVGSDLMIPCSVDGYPIPTVVWYKDGRTIRNNERTQITGMQTNGYFIHVFNHTREHNIHHEHDFFVLL